MACWLVKTEPSEYSIERFAKDGAVAWEGVRNYQARNYLREMKKGDTILVYHSSEEPIGIAGLGKVMREASPDESQFNKRSKYFDEKATKLNPVWFSPTFVFERKFSSLISPATLKQAPGLKKMGLLKKGNRLSVLPVSAAELNAILKLSKS